ncbi:hypothetical protein, partial [Amycolatopsis sp. WAC 01375]|uniref:hypothetical protein n=1 Tax=Amycolatopsis sp. WAC 01375 TaxID=2203194 RepID=UPI001F1DAEAB
VLSKTLIQTILDLFPLLARQPGSWHDDLPISRHHLQQPIETAGPFETLKVSKGPFTTHRGRAGTPP